MLAQDLTRLSHTVLAGAGAALIAVGAYLALWQGSQSADQSAGSPTVASYDAGALTHLQALVPNLAPVLVGVAAVTVLLMYRSRPGRI